MVSLGACGKVFTCCISLVSFSRLLQFKSSTSLYFGNTYLKMSTTTVIERKPLNLAVHTNPEHSLHLVNSDIPEPGPDDCLIHVRATGICGSDVHFWKHGHIGDMVVCGENGLGHESAGSVLKVGSNVTDFQPGKNHSQP